MSKWCATALAVLLAFSSGCGGEDAPDAPDTPATGVVDELHEALDRYQAGSMHETVDTPENEALILDLLKQLAPLEGDREVEAALDVFLLYDATDNAASARAREMLVETGAAALPLVRARLAMAQDPAKINTLIADIEAE